MTTADGNLRAWIRDLRPRGIERDGTLIFRPLPLHLALMSLFSEDDRPETEAEVLDHLGNQLQLRELITVSWWDPENGPSDAAIAIAHTPEDGLLVLDSHDRLAAIALGPERDLQAVAAESPDLVFPRLAARGALLREVVVRYDVCWTQEDLSGIVEALVGVRPVAEQVLRADLLSVEMDDSVPGGVSGS